MSNKEIEIPVLVKTPSTPDGSVGGIWKFRSLWQKAFGTIAKHPYVLAIIAFVYSGKRALEAWHKQDAAINSLNQSLIRQGTYTKQLSAQYQQNAVDLEKTSSFSDQEAMAAQAAMQPYLKGMKISKELLRGVANFAIAQKIDLVKAAAVVGRTIGTSTNALMRQGVEIQSNLVGQERLAAVVDALNKKWGGQSEAQVQGLGAIPQAANALNNLLEIIGKALAPFVILTVQELTYWARKTLESKKFVELMNATVAGLEVTISFSKAFIKAAISVIPESFRKYVGGVTGFLEKRTQHRVEAFRQKIPRIATISKKVKKQREKELENYFKGKLVHHGKHWETRKGIIGEAKKARENAFNNVFSIRDGVMRNIGQEGEAFIERQIVEMRLNSDKKYQLTLERMKTERNRSELKKLELTKMNIEEETLAATHKDLASKDNKVQMKLDEEKRLITENALSHLSNLKESKYGPQVLIGKAASIIQIGISTKLAIVGAMEACAYIPPPVGPALGIAIAGFLALYGEEQIKNIVNSDIDNPGRIGEIPFSFNSIVDIVGRQITDQYTLIAEIAGIVLEGAGDTVDKVKGELDKVVEETGILGQALAFPFQFYADLSASAFHIAADLFNEYVNLVGDIIDQVVDLVKIAVSEFFNSFAEMFSDIGDALFGWLFAEGGTVTHDTSGTPKITPLHKSGLMMGVKVNVTIKGGIVPSQQGAQRMAALIAANLRG